MHCIHPALYRRMGLHQRHIGMTGTMNSLALYSLTQYFGLRPILFQCTKSNNFAVLVKCTNTLTYLHSFLSLFLHQCLCGRGRQEGGITCWVTHVHARRQRERPNLCSYSYMGLNGSELVGCWGSEYKGLAPETMPGRCSTCVSIQMHTGVGIQ